MADLYAIVVKDKDSQDSKILSEDSQTSWFKRRLIFCSINQHFLMGYIEEYLKPFNRPINGKKHDYDLINIQPLVNSGFISRKSLIDVTDCSAYGTLTQEKALSNMLRFKKIKS